MIQRMDFRVFCHATENEDRVRRALSFVTGSNEIRTTKAEGFHGNRILIFETELGAKESMRFAERLKRSGILAALDDRLGERVDEACILHLRFDKQKACMESLELAEHDDVIAMKAKLGTYPRSRRAAVRALMEYAGK